MNYVDILRTKPYLKKCNINNICDRFLRATNGNAFVVFNNIQQAYEIHTIEAYHLSGDSYNVSIPLDSLNNTLIVECIIQDFSKNMDEIMSEAEKAERFKNHWEETRREKVLDQQMKIIGRVMGTQQ